MVSYRTPQSIKIALKISKKGINLALHRIANIILFDVSIRGKCFFLRHCTVSIFLTYLCRMERTSNITFKTEQSVKDHLISMAKILNFSQAKILELLISQSWSAYEKQQGEIGLSDKERLFKALQMMPK